MNAGQKLYEAHGILRECFGDNGVWADPSRYRRQCWTRDFGLAIQPLLLTFAERDSMHRRAGNCDSAEQTIAERHLCSLEARQRPDGQIPIVFLDGWRGHARFLSDKIARSLRDRKLSFMLGRYLQGQLGQLTPGTRDSELLYIVAALEHAERTGLFPVSMDSIKLAMRYIKRNLLDSRGLLLGADWRDTMHLQLREKPLLTNNALLFHAYDLLSRHGDNKSFWETQAHLQRDLINKVFWDGSLLQDWPRNNNSKQRFDPLGASLAVLFDVIPPERYADVWKGFDSVDSPYGVTIRCRHNPVRPEEGAIIERTDGQVIWPFVVGFAAMAMDKMAKKTGLNPFEASRQLYKLYNLEGFREWYDPATGKGYGAQRQLWSATLFTRAYLAINPDSIG